MNRKKTTTVTSITATSFSSLSEEHKIWRSQHLEKEKIYAKYSEFIAYLEMTLDIFTDPVDQKKIKKQIKKIKKLRDFYKESSILSVQFDEELMNYSDESLAVLKIKKRKEYE